MKKAINNRKGFTLVELLAVIVILAVLILLALPTVLNIMETARKNALKTEGLSILNAAETKYTAESALETGTPPSWNYDDLSDYVEVKEGYTVEVTMTGNEFSIDISNGKYVICELTRKNAQQEDGPEVVEGTTCP